VLDIPGAAEDAVAVFGIHIEPALAALGQREGLLGLALEIQQQAEAPLGVVFVLRVFAFLLRRVLQRRHAAGDVTRNDQRVRREGRLVGTMPAQAGEGRAQRLGKARAHALGGFLGFFQHRVAAQVRPAGLGQRIHQHAEIAARQPGAVVVARPVLEAPPQVARLARQRRIGQCLDAHLLQPVEH
jgi:hypothetical protein